MDRLENRIRAHYALAIAIALIGVTLFLGFVAYAIQIRRLESAASEALEVYVQRARAMPPVTSKNQVEQVIAGTSHPGWVLRVSGSRNRYIVQWPSRSILMTSRTVLPPESFPWNVGRGLSTIVGVSDAPKAFVSGIEFYLTPTASYEAITKRTFWITLLAILLELVVAVRAGKILARRTLRPLRKMYEELAHIAETGAEVPHGVQDVAHDQLGGLIGTYNRAIDALNNARAQRDAAELRTHQFIADAGHQLRTPLTVLSGFVGILSKGQLRHPDDGPKILQKMTQQLAVMRKLVDRLMVLEGWHSNEEPESEIADIGAFVTNIVDPIAASRPQTSLRINAIKGAIANIDSAELTYAVTNLVANAIKYAPDGSIDVDVSVDPKYVYISVADEGRGIPPDELPHIFERFYRGSRRDVPGSGLGLAIAMMAVERAGGTLAAKNRATKGAMFTITLPRVTSDVTTDTAPESIDAVTTT